jgi:hypothetical protein
LGNSAGSGFEYRIDQRYPVALSLMLGERESLLESSVVPDSSLSGSRPVSQSTLCAAKFAGINGWNKKAPEQSGAKSGAGEEGRTPDLMLGKHTL